MKTSSERLGAALLRAHEHWQKSHAPTSLAGKPAPTPLTVAISREPGTNAGSVAAALGERLGWPVYDHELIEKIAQELGLHASLVDSVDEKHTSWLRECVEAFASATVVN